MIKPVYVIKPFDLIAALTLVLIIGVCGHAFGFSTRSFGIDYIDSSSIVCARITMSNHVPTRRADAVCQKAHDIWQREASASRT